MSTSMGSTYMAVPPPASGLMVFNNLPLVLENLLVVNRCVSPDDRIAWQWTWTKKNAYSINPCFKYICAQNFLICGGKMQWVFSLFEGLLEEKCPWTCTHTNPWHDTTKYICMNHWHESVGSLLLSPNNTMEEKVSRSLKFSERVMTL
jgi:hypothetical protein